MQQIMLLPSPLGFFVAFENSVKMSCFVESCIVGWGKMCQYQNACKALYCAIVSIF